MRPAARALLLAAGGCDAATGLALLAAPLATLGLLGVDSGPRDPALIRFIGAFVLGVGASSLLALVRRWDAATVAEATALVRLAVGGYVVLALARGWLPAPWVLVALTDLGLAAAQLALAASGAFGEGR